MSDVYFVQRSSEKTGAYSIDNHIRERKFPASIPSVSINKDTESISCVNPQNLEVIVYA